MKDIRTVILNAKKSGGNNCNNAVILSAAGAKNLFDLTARSFVPKTRDSG